MSASADWERILASALCEDDPPAALRRASEDERHTPALRAALARAAAQVDGVRVAALLVARLRFERLIRGSARAETWFERDAADFAETFRRYHREVAPTAYFPRAEAALFEAWLER